MIDSEPLLPAVPAILFLPGFDEGKFQFRIAGTPRRRMSIEVLTDGVEWKLLREIIKDDGPTMFVDEETDGHAIRFYRVVTH